MKRKRKSRPALRFRNFSRLTTPKNQPTYAYRITPGDAGDVVEQIAVSPQPDPESATISIDDANAQLLRQYAAMASSDSPTLREAGRRKLAAAAAAMTDHAFSAGNLTSSNDARKSDADVEVIAAFRAWRERLHPTVMSTAGRPWTIKQQVRAYHKQKNPSQAKKRRLNALADKGELD